jgi:hypothetical protein
MAQKGEIKITDQQVEAIKLYEQGQTAAQVSTALGIPAGSIRSQMGKFKKLGILTGSHKERSGVTVDWDRLEEIKAGRLPAITDEPQEERTGVEDTAPSESRSKDVATEDTSALQSRSKPVAVGFTSEETAILKAWAQQMLARERSERSGKIEPRNVRVDLGLYEALREKNKKEDISIGEAVNRAIEGYLSAG